MFTKDTLIKLLKELTGAQESIEKVSIWLQQYKDEAPSVVQVWKNFFFEATNEKKLTLLYLVNDVVQHSKRKGPQFVDAFGHVLPKCMAECRDHGAKNQIERMLDIWESREIFHKHVVHAMKFNLDKIGMDDSFVKLTDLLESLDNLRTLENRSSEVLTMLSQRLDTTDFANAFNVTSRKEGDKYAGDFDETATFLEQYCSCLSKQTTRRTEMLRKINSTLFQMEKQEESVKNLEKDSKGKQTQLVRTRKAITSRLMLIEEGMVNFGDDSPDREEIENLTSEEEDVDVEGIETIETNRVGKEDAQEKSGGLANLNSTFEDDGIRPEDAIDEQKAKPIEVRKPRKQIKKLPSYDPRQILSYGFRLDATPNDEQAVGFMLLPDGTLCAVPIAPHMFLSKPKPPSPKDVPEIEGPKTPEEIVEEEKPGPKTPSAAGSEPEEGEVSDSDPGEAEKKPIVEDTVPYDEEVDGVPFDIAQDGYATDEHASSPGSAPSLPSPEVSDTEDPQTVAMLNVNTWQDNYNVSQDVDGEALEEPHNALEELHNALEEPDNASVYESPSDPESGEISDEDDTLQTPKTGMTGLAAFLNTFSEEEEIVQKEVVQKEIVQEEVVQKEEPSEYEQFYPPGYSKTQKFVPVPNVKPAYLMGSNVPPPLKRCPPIQNYPSKIVPYQNKPEDDNPLYIGGTESRVPYEGLPPHQKCPPFNGSGDIRPRYRSASSDNGHNYRPHEEFPIHPSRYGADYPAPPELYKPRRTLPQHYPQLHPRPYSRSPPKQPYPPRNPQYRPQYIGPRPAPRQPLEQHTTRHPPDSGNVDYPHGIHPQNHFLGLGPRFVQHTTVGSGGIIRSYLLVSSCGILYCAIVVYHLVVLVRKILQATLLKVKVDDLYPKHKNSNVKWESFNVDISVYMMNGYTPFMYQVPQQIQPQVQPQMRPQVQSVTFQPSSFQPSPFQQSPFQPAPFPVVPFQQPTISPAVGVQKYGPPMPLSNFNTPQHHIPAQIDDSEIQKYKPLVQQSHHGPPLPFSNSPSSYEIPVNQYVHTILTVPTVSRDPQFQPAVQRYNTNVRDYKSETMNSPNGAAEEEDSVESSGDEQMSQGSKSSHDMSESSDESFDDIPSRRDSNYGSRNNTDPFGDIPQPKVKYTKNDKAFSDIPNPKTPLTSLNDTLNFKPFDCDLLKQKKKFKPLQEGPLVQAPLFSSFPKSIGGGSPKKKDESSIDRIASLYNLDRSDDEISGDESDLTILQTVFGGEKRTCPNFRDPSSVHARLTLKTKSPPEKVNQKKVNQKKVNNNNSGKRKRNKQPNKQPNNKPASKVNQKNKNRSFSEDSITEVVKKDVQAQKRTAPIQLNTDLSAEKLKFLSTSAVTPGNSAGNQLLQIRQELDETRIIVLSDAEQKQADIMKEIQKFKDTYEKKQTSEEKPTEKEDLKQTEKEAKQADMIQKINEFKTAREKLKEEEKEKLMKKIAEWKVQNEKEKDDLQLWKEGHPYTASKKENTPDEAEKATSSVTVCQELDGIGAANIISSDKTHVITKETTISTLPSFYQQAVSGGITPLQRPPPRQIRPLHFSTPDYSYGNLDMYQPGVPGIDDANVGYKDPNMGYQDPNMGYQDPNMGYQDPNMGYQDPSMGYQDPSMGYQDPSMGYQDPNMGYQDPNMGYNNPNLRFHGQPRGPVRGPSRMNWRPPRTNYANFPQHPMPHGLKSGPPRSMRQTFTQQYNHQAQRMPNNCQRISGPAVAYSKQTQHTSIPAAAVVKKQNPAFKMPVAQAAKQPVPVSKKTTIVNSKPIMPKTVTPKPQVIIDPDKMAKALRLKEAIDDSCKKIKAESLRKRRFDVTPHDLAKIKGTATTLVTRTATTVVTITESTTPASSGKNDQAGSSSTKKAAQQSLDIDLDDIDNLVSHSQGNLEF